MNVSAARPTPAAVTPAVVRPTRRKDADGDYDGPAKTTAAPTPTTAAVTANGRLDVHA